MTESIRSGSLYAWPIMKHAIAFLIVGALAGSLRGEETFKKLQKFKPDLECGVTSKATFKNISKNVTLRVTNTGECPIVIDLDGKPAVSQGTFGTITFAPPDKKIKEVEIPLACSQAEKRAKCAATAEHTEGDDGIDDLGSGALKGECDGKDVSLPIHYNRLPQPSKPKDPPNKQSIELTVTNTGECPIRVKENGKAATDEKGKEVPELKNKDVGHCLVGVDPGGMSVPIVMCKAEKDKKCEFTFAMKLKAMK